MNPAWLPGASADTPAGLADDGSPTFFAAPRWRGERGGIVLLGAPFDRTSADLPAGSKLAPGALRRLSGQWPVVAESDGARPRGWYHEGLGRPVLSGQFLYDGGDVPLSGALAGEEADRRVAQRVAQVMAHDGLPCLIGGEHALTRPALRAVAAGLGRAPFLLFLDAHGDRGVSHWGGHYPRDAFVDGILADGSVCGVLQLGLRDVVAPVNAPPPGPGPLTVLSPRQARRLGWAALAGLVPVDQPLYLSLDIDVLAPEAAPATRTPLPGGLTVDELLELLEGLLAAPRLVACDLMELDPSRDRAELTQVAALHLLLATLEGRRR